MVGIFGGCGSFRDHFGRAKLGTPQREFRLTNLGQLAGPTLAKNFRLSRPKRVQANVTACIAR
jgi:hypothetical protein